MLLNQDLRKLREEFNDSKETGDDFTEATNAQFKDVANAIGNFGNHLRTLEIQVKKLLAKKDGK